MWLTEKEQTRGPWPLTVGSGTINMVAELSLAPQCVEVWKSHFPPMHSTSREAGSHRLLL